MATIPLSSLSLFPATREQIKVSRTRSFDSWGGGTTLAQYLARDDRSDNREVAQNNRLVTWVLAPQDAPESLDFMCSCETFRRDGLVVKKFATFVEKTPPEEVNCYAIASVFTPAANRGKGYARHMMRLLDWIIAPRSYLPEEFPAEWGVPPQRPSFIADGSFSVLYSDVGENFYSVCGPEPTKSNGWIVTRPISTTWDVVKSYNLIPSDKRNTRSWKWLDENLVNEIWKADAVLMKEEMSKELSAPLIEFTYLPTRGVAEFQHHRLQHFWQQMNPNPVHWGLFLHSDADMPVDASTFATWTLDIRPPDMNKLVITRLRCQPEGLEALLFNITDFAKKHSIDKIEIWNLAENLKDIAHRVGGTTFSRDEHLPSFKWYGGENPKDATWIYNEKFCWC